VQQLQQALAAATANAAAAAAQPGGAGGGGSSGGGSGVAAAQAALDKAQAASEAVIKAPGGWALSGPALGTGRRQRAAAATARCPASLSSKPPAASQRSSGDLTRCMARLHRCPLALLHLLQRRAVPSNSNFLFHPLTGAQSR
jgi:hypothetical protein